MLILSFSMVFLSTAISQSDNCYSLIWADEFEGTSLDLTKWRYQNGGWNGSNVQNCYAPENAAVSGGSLKITAQHEPGYDCFNTTTDFTSGFVQTKDRASWTFGYFEARVKMPTANSTWPAFWMSPQNAVYGAWPQSGEIDIFEIKGHDMTKAYGNAHWGNSAADKVQNKGTYTVNDANNWHVYAVEWQLGELKFYIDGNHYHTINNFNEPNAGTHPQPFDIPFYLRLNMAVGGDYLAAPYNDANNGIDQLPAVMEVDWVRVYQKENNCTTIAPCELIVNNNFDSNTENWEVKKFNGADGNMTVTNDGFLKVEVTHPGTSNWHLGIRQRGLLLENGKIYNVSYDAYADAPRTSNVIVGKTDGTQYYYYGQSLTTTPATYSFQFTMPQETDTNAVITLNSGATAISVYYDNISITPSDCNPCSTNLNIANQDIYPGTYQVSQTISSNAKVATPDCILFKGQEILLEAGFEVEGGAKFEVQMEPCSGN